jgi:adenylate cyclase
MAEQRTKRRLAAIMAADVAGYSRLMGHNEAGTLAQLKECRTEVIDPNLARYDGRIVKVMGDGLLVEFSSAVDAVESALDLQTTLAKRNDGAPATRRMTFRARRCASKQSISVQSQARRGETAKAGAAHAI